MDYSNMKTNVIPIPTVSIWKEQSKIIIKHELIKKEK